jgi:hypothetical protein
MKTEWKKWKRPKRGNRGKVKEGKRRRRDKASHGAEGEVRLKLDGIATHPIDPFDGAQTPLFMTEKEAPLRVNPEQAPAFRPESRRVDR